MNAPIETLMAFAEQCSAQIPATIDAVMRDQPYEREPWISAAGMYHACRTDIDTLLDSAERAKSLHALGTLAELMAADDGHTATAAHQHASTGGADAVAALIEVASAWKQSRANSAPTASTFHRLADGLMQLLPHWKRDAASSVTALERIADLFRRSVDRYLGDGAPAPALGPTASCVAVSTGLARNFGLRSRAAEALELAELVVGANTPDTANQFGLAVLCVNATGTAKWLAAATGEADFTERALKLAYRCKSALEKAPADSDPHVLLQLTQACLRNLPELHMQIARRGGPDAQLHINSAHTHLAELQQFAVTQQDRDVSLYAKAVEKKVKGAAAPGDAGSAVKTVQRFQSESIEVAEQIIAAGDPARQKELLARALREIYDGLSMRSAQVVREVGLNHHVCRIVLALGALISGRLGRLAISGVHAMVTRFESAGDPNRSDLKAQIAQRQRVFATEQLEAEMEIVARLRGLAILHVSFADHGDLLSMLQNLSRAENKRFLRHLTVLPDAARVLREPLSRFRDLHTALALLPQAVRASALAGYSKSPLSEAVGSHGPAADLTVPRQRGPRSGNEGLASTSPQEIVASMEDLRQAGWKGIPEIKMEQVDESGDLSTADVQVGNVFRMDGRLTRIDGILGKGTEKTVYSLTDIESGQHKALAVYHRENADALRERLNSLLSNLDEHADEVLEVCDKLLRIDPTDEVVAYNKGVILLNRKNYAGALECFEIALEKSPRDIANLLHRVAALAFLERSDPALEGVLQAIRIDAGQTAAFLRQLPWLTQAISDAAQSAHSTDGHGELAAAVLKWVAAATR